MSSVIIIAQRGFHFEELRRSIPATYSVKNTENECVVIESGERRAYLGADAGIINELEPEEAARILEIIRDPVFSTLDLSDIGFCKDLLFAIADRSDVLIDNDHGVVMPGSEFLRVLRSQGEWDWRRDR